MVKHAFQGSRDGWNPQELGVPLLQRSVPLHSNQQIRSGVAIGVVWIWWEGERRIAGVSELVLAIYK
jgi:hypothetical protein